MKSRPKRFKSCRTDARGSRAHCETGRRSGHAVDGASDHTSHLVVYISDPDRNGIELAWDRSPEFRKFMLDGKLTPDAAVKLNKRLDISAPIAEAT
jgi:hypothetical protein